MLHQIENPFIKADLNLPINYYEPDLRRNYSNVEGMRGETKKISDLLENDDTRFKGLFDVHTDSAQETTSTTQRPSHQRKSKFRKRRNASKSKRFSNARNGSRSQLDSQRKLVLNNSRRFSDSRQSFESLSDSERQPKTTKTSRQFDDHLKNPRTSYSQTGPREKERKSVSNDEIKPKKENIQEQHLTESQSDFHQEKTHKNMSSNQTGKLASTNSSTGTDHVIDHGKLQGIPGNSSNDHALVDNQTIHIKFKPKYDNKLKGPVIKPSSLDTQDMIFQNQSNLEQHSSKVVSKHQGSKPRLNITDNKQDSDQLPKTSSEKRRSLLIFGDDRSGTTFVTQMFAADPQMFTVYEPLWVTKKWFSKLVIEDDKQVKLTEDVVNALLSCQFTRSKAGTAFLAYTPRTWLNSASVFEKNVFRTASFATKTKTGRKTWPNLYQHPEFAEDVCLNKFKHSVVKVGQIRVPYESISVFIPRVFHANPDTDIRILHIVRDPRGSINSRIKNGWISDFTYEGFPELAGNICDKIEANVQFGRDLESDWLKERYMEISYRDITTMPITTAKKIYKFAGFEMPDSLIDWIVKSTNPDEDELIEALHNPYSHVRDSSRNNVKWRSESPIKRVRVIEQQCKKLLDLLGLDEVADEMETLCS